SAGSWLANSTTRSRDQALNCSAKAARACASRPFGSSATRATGPARRVKSQDVRQFAEHMIQDHGKMVEETSSLATTKDVTPPDGPSVMQMTEITALKALSGGAFDAMYVNRIGVASHE